MFPEGNHDPRVLRCGTMDDLAQEAVLVLLDKQQRGYYNPEKGVWSAWAYRTSGWAALVYTSRQRVVCSPATGGMGSTKAGRLREECRERTRHIRSLTGKLLSVMGRNDPSIEEWEETDHLRWCLDRLTDSECELLNSHFVEEISMRQIGRDTGLRGEAVWDLTNDALDRLRELYFFGKTTC